MANNRDFKRRFASGQVTAQVLGATEANMRAAVQDMAQEANTSKTEGGLLPFLNGHLQNSFRAESPSGGVALYPTEAAAIVKTDLGDPIILSWHVDYAKTQEFGDPSRNIPANGFARAAAAKLPLFIKKHQEG